MKTIASQLRFILFILLLSLLNACGGDGGSGGGGNTPSNSQNDNNNTPNSNGNDDNNESGNRGIAGLSGLITLDEYDNLLGKKLGVVSFRLSNGQVSSRAKKVVSGRFPHRHKNGKLLNGKPYQNYPKIDC